MGYFSEEQIFLNAQKKAQNDKLFVYLNSKFLVYCIKL